MENKIKVSFNGKVYSRMTGLEYNENLVRLETLLSLEAKQLLENNQPYNENLSYSITLIDNKNGKKVFIEDRKKPIGNICVKDL